MAFMRHCLCGNDTELRVGAGAYSSDSSIQEARQEAVALEVSLGYRVGLLSKKRKKKREELEGDSI